MVNCAEIIGRIDLSGGTSSLSLEDREQFGQLEKSEHHISRTAFNYKDGDTLLFLRRDKSPDPDGKKICNRVTLSGFQLGYENNQGVFVKDLREIK